jgi:adenosyl cobinamide kinase/adenosyl cobinamide phosphate guanylyltransferase
MAEGRAEGMAEGRAEGMAKAVIMVLTARGLAPDDTSRQRILDEHDASRLERWIVRATTCVAVAELLAER